MKIDFIGIGTQKAGTSTLHDILKQHPQVELPYFKESHFFNDDEKFNKGLDYYFNYFFKKGNKPFTGEIVPEYSYFDYCAQRIFDALGPVKTIFILRNPVDRAYSHYLMTKRRGLETLSFMEAVNEESSRLTTYKDKVHYSYIDRGRYSDQLIRYYDIFGKSKVKVILFDDFISNLEETVTSIADFIGLPTYDYNFDIKANSASEPKSTLLRDFIHKPNALKKSVGRLIPSQKFKDYFMDSLNKTNLKTATKERFPEEDKKAIYETFFKEELERLELILNLNLSHWKY